MDRLRLASTFDQKADFILHEGDTLDLLSQMPDGLVKLVVTSPPYNLGKPYETRLEVKDYIQQQRMVIEECIRVLSERGSICWQVGNYVDASPQLKLLENASDYEVKETQDESSL